MFESRFATKRQVGSLLQGSALIALGMFSFGLAAELLTRLLVPRTRWAFRDATSDWQPDPRLGWVQKPNLNVMSQTDFGWIVHFRTNRDGLTPFGASRERAAEVVRVMFFGDSTVVGRSVPEDSTVSAQLERALGQTGVRAEVLNAGVEGYSTDQVMLRMEQLVPLYRPDIVFYGLCDNDFGGNVSSEFAGNPKPRFVLREGSLVEIPPPRIDRITPLGGGPRTLLQHSAFYRLIQPRVFTLRARFGGWEKRNLLGVAPEIYWRPGELDRIDWRLLGALLSRMSRFVQQHGGRLVVYSHPALGEIWDPFLSETIRIQHLDPSDYDRYALERRLAQVVAESAAEFCPLIDAFLAQQGRGPFHLLPRDPHCNPIGYEIAAQALAECLNRHGRSLGRSSRKTPVGTQHPTPTLAGE